MCAANNDSSGWNTWSLGWPVGDAAFVVALAVASDAIAQRPRAWFPSKHLSIALHAKVEPLHCCFVEDRTSRHSLSPRDTLRCWIHFNFVCH